MSKTISTNAKTLGNLGAERTIVIYRLHFTLLHIRQESLKVVLLGRPLDASLGVVVASQLSGIDLRLLLVVGELLENL
jgi:hypothetical protein